MVRELLKKLSNAHGLSGSEGSVMAIVKRELKNHVDEIHDDPLGNLITVKKGNDFKVMLAAHADEIGLMVKSIDEKGFLRFVTLGGWYPPTLYNQRVILHGAKGPVPGVLGGKPPHKMDEEERKKGVKVDDLFIDIGARDREEAEAAGIEIGTPGTMDRQVVELVNGRMTGKAFDNRAGVAVLVRTLQKVRSPFTIYGVFTVQEEVGLKGARTSAYSIDPDCAVATDVTFPGDHPGIDQKDVPVELGKGPIITIADASGRGLIASRAMVAWLKDTAKKHDIPVQLEVGSGGTTDATAIHLERGGIPSTTLSVPTRYIHSPVEVLDPTDIENAVELLVQALKTRPKL
ncbi:MAG TPA: M42 family metallopeptidase [Methanoregulaceae archaeon]|nr:MAG: M42 family metallopeptidase [Methanolinea sp.]HON82070.1 M42 family metallopeptidase [Methanoregulaceae archaeon]HPD10768.1 M42 family metallopeptidase [Methanoregulaceae archaeon]HRT15956.1 M42 family metallopeptidase [Methanoregulaceae archaeon]HRU31421.1 M42 family metallopeptidase [Methanoregulaceae archaeon]